MPESLPGYDAWKEASEDAWARDWDETEVDAMFDEYVGYLESKTMTEHTLKRMTRVRVLPHQQDVERLREEFATRGYDVSGWDCHDLYRDWCNGGWWQLLPDRLPEFVHWSMQYLKEDV